MRQTFRVCLTVGFQKLFTHFNYWRIATVKLSNALLIFWRWNVQLKKSLFPAKYITVLNNVSLTVNFYTTKNTPWNWREFIWKKEKIENSLRVERAELTDWRNWHRHESTCIKCSLQNSGNIDFRAISMKLYLTFSKIINYEICINNEWKGRIITFRRASRTPPHTIIPPADFELRTITAIDPFPIYWWYSTVIVYSHTVTFNNDNDFSSAKIWPPRAIN